MMRRASHSALLRQVRCLRDGPTQMRAFMKSLPEADRKGIPSGFLLHLEAFAMESEENRALAHPSKEVMPSLAACAKRDMPKSETAGAALAQKKSPMAEQATPRRLRKSTKG